PRLDAVSPPNTAPEALSGWPSRSAVRRNRACRSIASPSSALAAATPAAQAEALLPSPLCSGIAFSSLTCRRGTDCPARAYTASIARTTAFVLSVGSSSAPSPETSTRTTGSPPPGRAVTSTVLYSASASARLSKPGPRFAEDAGTRTRTVVITSPPACTRITRLTAEVIRQRSEVGRERHHLCGFRPEHGVRVFKPMPGYNAHDTLPAHVHLAAFEALLQGCYACRRGGLDKHAFQRREQPPRLKDCLVSYGGDVPVRLV